MWHGNCLFILPELFWIHYPVLKWNMYSGLQTHLIVHCCINRNQSSLQDKFSACWFVPKLIFLKFHIWSVNKLSVSMKMTYKLTCKQGNVNMMWLNISRMFCAHNPLFCILFSSADETLRIIVFYRVCLSLIFTLLVIQSLLCESSVQAHLIKFK